MWKTGHSLIKDKMKEMNAPIAGEMSGHMFFSEGFYGHDDALYGAARLLRILADSGKTVAQMLADVPDFVSTPELRIEVPRGAQVRARRAAVKYFRVEARRHRRRRRARALRRRLGTDSRLEHAAGDRRALRGADRRSASPRFAARWKDGCASRACECDMTTRRWLIVGAGGRRGPADRRPLAGRRLRRLSLVRGARRRRALARAHERRSPRCASARCSSPALFAFVNLYAVRQSVVSLVLPRRIGEPRDRRRGAGPISDGRRRRSRR